MKKPPRRARPPRKIPPPPQVPIPTDGRLLTEQEASAYLRVSVATLQVWRSLGKGPAYVKMTESESPRQDQRNKGVPVRYRLEDLMEFAAKRVLRPGSGRREEAA